MSDAEIRELAKALAAELGGSIISSTFPAAIGEWVRQTARQSAVNWRFSIPMSGSTGLLTDWRLNPDGTIILELQDTNAQMFWRGTFRPAEES